jgi:transcriptional regulator with XRE-family HTH domain
VAQKRNRIYSGYTLEALSLLSKYIKAKRLERRITTQELADRATISRGLLRRIENADPNCSIGTVFEVASILEISLFSASYESIVAKNNAMDEKLALLPREARKRKIGIDDDF